MPLAGSAPVCAWPPVRIAIDHRSCATAWACIRRLSVPSANWMSAPFEYGDPASGSAWATGRDTSRVFSARRIRSYSRSNTAVRASERLLRVRIPSFERASTLPASGPRIARSGDLPWRRQPASAVSPDDPSRSARSTRGALWIACTKFARSTTTSWSPGCSVETGAAETRRRRPFARCRESRTARARAAAKAPKGRKGSSRVLEKPALRDLAAIAEPAGCANQEVYPWVRRARVSCLHDPCSDDRVHTNIPSHYDIFPPFGEQSRMHSRKG